MSLYADSSETITVGDVTIRDDGAVGRVIEIEGGRPHANVTVDFGAAGRSYEYPSSLRFVERQPQGETVRLFEPAPTQLEGQLTF